MRTWAYERKFVMPVRRLPSNPSLDHLKYQAKDLLRDLKSRALDAAQRIREFHPRFAQAADSEIFDARFTLSDAHLAIARESGFPSWTKLKRRVEKPVESDRLDLPYQQRIEDKLFRRAVDLIDSGQTDDLSALLQQHPHLVQQRVVLEGSNYFENPSLLEFIAENPVRHGRMPANIVDVAKVILDAGTTQEMRDTTLSLVSTGTVPYESGKQRALINLLCDYGTDPNSAIRIAAILGGHDAVLALLARSAKMTLPVAAALGRVQEARDLLDSASPEDRHLALSVAADFGRLEIVRLLLDAGENPDRYNPIGGHSHTTPLHQAALNGHEDVVRLLLSRGARTDTKDILFKGTPADWAHHNGHAKIEKLLRSYDSGEASEPRT
jgi:Ankyrin repeats (3 copies)